MHQNTLGIFLNMQVSSLSQTLLNQISESGVQKCCSYFTFYSDIISNLHTKIARVVHRIPIYILYPDSLMLTFYHICFIVFPVFLPALRFTHFSELFEYIADVIPL